MSSFPLLANLVAYSLQVALLVGTGTLVLVLLRIPHPRARLFCWQSLLGLCLLLPVLQPWKKPVDPLTLASLHKTIRVEAILGPVSANTQHIPVGELLVYSLAASTGFRCLWLVLGLLRLRQYRRRAQLLDPPPLAVEEMQTKVGVVARSYLSTELNSPVTFGLRRPAVLFPSSFSGMEPAMQKAVACHELWHIRRKDWIFTVLEEFLVTPFWFHPAVWWLLDRIRLCREQVVDQLVLKTTRQRKLYLDALLEAALARHQPKLTPASPFLSRRHLTQRITSILKETSMSKTQLTLSLVTASVALLLTGMLAVKIFPLESGGVAESATTKAARADSTLQKPVVVTQELLAKSLVHKVQPLYSPEAKQLGIEGEVLLEVIVSAKGEMEDIRVTKGHPLLVRSALDAVKDWRYQPYLVSGAAVPVISTVSVNFTLQDSSGGPGKKPESPLVRLNSDAMAANVIYKVEPIYPPEAKQKGVEGEVVFEVTINEQGEVSDVQVLSGNAMLVSAAYEGVRQWRYTPVLLNGDPIRAKATVTIRFELEKGKGTASASRQDRSPSDTPNPLADVTPEEHSRRVTYADERFATPHKPGSQKPTVVESI